MKSKGFSLIELLIVIAIIGILAATAIPAYLGTQTKTRRESALESIQALSSAMELYYQEHNNYGVDCSNTNACTTQYPSFKPKNNYSYSVDVGNTGQTFVITCSSPDFGSYSEVTIDENGTVTWVK